MSDINITADISDLVAKTAQMLNLTNAQVAALNAYTNATVKWNNTGQGTIATLSAQISATQTLNATIRETANGTELLSAKVVQSNKRIEAAQRAATKAAQDAARAQTKAAQDAAKAAEEAAKKTQAAFATRIAETVQRNTQNQRSQIGEVGGTVSPKAQSDLLASAKAIGELGAKAGLTQKQISDLYAKVNTGDLSGIEAKYARLVSAIVRYNGIIEAERNKLAKNAIDKLPGGANGPPGPSSENLSKLRDYFGILNRIGSTLTNLAIYRGFNILTNNITQSISAAREYQVQVGLIRTISQDAQLSAEQWAGGLRSVSNALGLEFQDVAKAAYDSISNQIVKGQQTFAFLTEAGQLAKTTGTNIRDAADVISSVLNSYNLTAERSGEISAKLFATIDRGRIVMSELQGTIGRVTFLANDLGVSMEEVFAILATLTRNGIKTSDAITLLNNGMQKLTKPTERAGKFLESIGFSSGRAAVGVLKLSGTLQELIRGVESGQVDATDIFNEARSERFFAGIRGNLSEVSSDLDYITNRSGTVYENAKKIVEETDANRINTAITTFKNALASTAGDAFNSAVVGFFNLDKSAQTADERMKSITESARTLFRVLVTGGAAIGTLVLTIKALGAAQAIQAAATTRSTLAEGAAFAARLRANGLTGQAIALELQLANAKRTSAAAGGLSALSSVGRGAGALALTAGVGYLAYRSTQSEEGFSQTAEAADDLVKRIRAEELNRNLKVTVDLARLMKTEFDGTTQAFGRLISEAARVNNLRIGNLREEMKAIAGELGQLFDGIQELAKRPIQELEAELGRITSLQQRIKKDREGGVNRETAQAGLLATSNKFANPTQQLQLINSEYNRLEQRIQALVSRNTAESLEEARTLQGRKLQLVQQYYEKEGDIGNTAFQQSIQQAVAEGRAPAGNYTYQFDQSRQVAATNRELARQASLEDQIAQRLEAAKKLREEELAKAKAAEDARKKAVDEFTNFDVFTPNGQVKTDFQGPNGKLDQAKALAKLQELAQTARASLGSDATSRLQGDTLIRQREAQARELVLRANGAADLAESQRRSGEAQRSLTERLNTGENAVRAYNQAVTQLIGELGTLNRSFAETAGGAGGRFQDAFLRSGNSLASGNVLSREINRARLELQKQGGTSARGVEVAAAEEELTRLEARARALDDRIKELPNQKITREGREIIDPEAIARATTEARALQTAIGGATERLGRAYGVEGGANVYLQGTQRALSSTIEVLDNFDRRFNAARQGLETGIQTIATTTAAMNDLRLQTEAVNQTFGRLNAGVTEAVRQTGDVTTAQIANLQKLAAEADNVLKRMEQIARGRVVVGPDGTITPIENAQPGIEVPRQGRAYGGPIGHDNVPTWLSQGEYVVNAAATRRYASQIASFNNQARVPQYFNNGGEVTNMGGVNINVYETKNPQQTAREVSRMLKRAKRQGSI